MNSKTYWERREEEALKKYIADEKEYQKRLEEIHRDMLDSIEKEIESFYGKYAKAEGITISEAKKRVSQADIEAYERKAKRYVKENNFSEQANEEMRLYNATMKINRLELLKANIGLELVAGHDELDKFMGEILQGRTVEELERQAGILGNTIKDNGKTAEAIVNASFHNAKFSDRIWMYQDSLKGEMSKLIQSGLIQGKSSKALAKELRKTVKTSVFNSERLMRSELARVQTEAQKLSFKNNGFEEYEFHANSSCCDTCQSFDGKHFKVSKMVIGENAPPLHPQCRCSTSAYEDSKEYEAWLDYLSKGGDTLSWNKLKDIVMDIQEGKTVEQSRYVGIIKLDSKDVRDWYVHSVARIKKFISKSPTMEEQARQAFTERNNLRLLAREMMIDEEKKKEIYERRPNKTFEELIEDKMQRKHLTREQAIQDIYKTATTTNSKVNKFFGLDGE